MNNTYTKLSLIVGMMLFLSGCMYPEEKRNQHEVPYLQQVQSVQTAVEQFQQENGGILPIKTRDQSTPIYQKYLIDFKRIVPGYLAEPPSNAYESGGVFQYVIMDAENNPTVKIFDLRIAETINEINLRIQSQGYPPYKEKIADNIFTLNYEKLGFDEEPYVISPFTNQKLPLVINGNAEVFVDYQKDLLNVLKKREHQYKPGEDIRNILLEDSLFVPAYSLPYTLDEKTNEPIFLIK
jgi:hypothetical protein